MYASFWSKGSLRSTNSEICISQSKQQLSLLLRCNGSDSQLGFFNETTQVSPLGVHQWFLFFTCGSFHTEPVAVNLKLTRVGLSLRWRIATKLENYDIVWKQFHFSKAQLRKCQLENKFDMKIDRCTEKTVWSGTFWFLTAFRL